MTITFIVLIIWLTLLTLAVAAIFWGMAENQSSIVFLLRRELAHAQKELAALKRKSQDSEANPIDSLPVIK